MKTHTLQSHQTVNTQTFASSGEAIETRKLCYRKVTARCALYKWIE